MAQNTVVIPSTGTLSGLSLVTDINSALDSLRSNFSGGSAPSADTPETGQLWFDTSTNKLKAHDGSTFCEIGAFDTSTDKFLSLAHNSGRLRYGVSINLATTGDTAIPLVLPVGSTAWILKGITFYNPSAVITTATVGLYTLANGGGNGLSNGSNILLNGLTSTSLNSSGSAQVVPLSSAIYDNTLISPPAFSIFANVTVVQAAATVKVAVEILPMPLNL